MFVDSKGREWHPRITADVIIKFEDRTNMGILATILELLQNTKGTPKADDFFVLAQKLFGRLGNIYYFLYASVEDEAKTKEIGFEEFCKSFSKEENKDAIVVCMRSIIDFLPGSDQVEEADAQGPFSPGKSETSSSSPPSQE